MKELMKKLKEEVVHGNACYLVALIESEGSTPRSSGAYMLVNKNGWVAGTVGGGGMEYAAVLEAQKRLLAYAEEEAKAKQTNEHTSLETDGKGVQAATSVTSAQRSFHKRFDLTPAAGMACGGYCSLQFC
ncbi:MAG: XdhC family protein, partial [Phascolarctobacterium sp.]|nr:XdhC family protein [Phascolarctobacterium sp.]